MATQAGRVLEVVREEGLLRPRDLEANGLTRETLRRLRERGLVVQVGRGLYALPESEPTENHALAVAAKRVPRGVVCLVSALSFHRLTTQMPHEVWLALDGRSRRPELDYPPLRVVRFSGEALSSGIEEHVIEGVPVRVYGPAKTVADCFKYRNKIGLDVALEALRDCWRDRRATMDELWHYAQVCRVGSVMRPYLEFLV